ncbi:MAG: sulfotransferase family 2 domain-containing protein [Saprospiraceae bacterium]|nr:sulfotransferase family 2 domain-containing protein [Saprospiraceae bacterium]
MVSNRKVYIISHLPKTGGSTLVAHCIEMHNDRFLVFHLGERARIGINNNFAHFEEFDFVSNQKDVVIIGHQVDEGVLNYFKGYDIKLLTILRQPIKRYFSHYNMVKGNGHFNGNINSFIREKNNFISLFFVSRFPSFVSNPLDNLQEQCKDVLNKFSNVYFLEDAPDSFNEILGLLNIKYNPALKDDRRTENYKDYMLEEQLSLMSYALVNPDCNLYYDLKEREIDYKRLSLNDFTPHLWYKNYCLPFFRKHGNEFRKFMISELNDGFLKSLLVAHIQKDSFDFNLLVHTAIKYATVFENRVHMLNLQDLVDYYLNKIEVSFRIPDNVPSEYQVAKLFKIIESENVSTLKTIKSRDLLEIENKNYELEIASARLYIGENKLDDAEQALNNALKLKLTVPIAFFLLSKVCLMKNKKHKAKMCLEKCMELKPNNINYREKYLSI